jgi:UDP-sulfoquinovose synthase
MRILVLGGDGYLGWPTAMSLAAAGHQVTVVDNYLRRRLARATDSGALFPTPRLAGRVRAYRRAGGPPIAFMEGDLSDYSVMSRAVSESRPEAIVHYAEQPSAPFSMRGRGEAWTTLSNNIAVTFNCIWATIEHVPECHIVKLGTMGEYGTPNIDIEEGWIEIEVNGRHDRFLFPRASGSLYHTSKILDTDLLWFYVRLYNIRVTDLMQGPVYGLITQESALDDKLLPNFHYDDIFGTVINRFVVEAVAGVPLTVYGSGRQTKGYINLRDTLKCIKLAIDNPPPPGEMRIYNQFTEIFSVNQLAEKVRSAAHTCGLQTDIRAISNPRAEKEVHHFNPRHSHLRDLGLEAEPMTEEVLCGMIEKVKDRASAIDLARIPPRVRW